MPGTRCGLARFRQAGRRDGSDLGRSGGCRGRDPLTRRGLAHAGLAGRVRVCRASGGGRRWRQDRLGDRGLLWRGAIGQPHVVDRMLDRMQTRAGGEHPPGKDALDLALERHLVNYEKGVVLRRLGRRKSVAHARGDLRRLIAPFADPRVEGDDAAGDLVESEKTARPFAIFCVGISVMIVSSGLGAVSAGWGGGGLAGCGVTRVRSTGGGAWPGAAGGAVVAPAGGGKGCLWTRRVNAPPETPAPILAPEIVPAAAVPGTRRWEYRRAGAAVRRRTWIGQRPVPPQAFRRAWPKGRRYGAWNLTRDRVSARDRVRRLTCRMRQIQGSVKTVGARIPYLPGVQAL